MDNIEQPIREAREKIAGALAALDYATAAQRLTKARDRVEAVAETVVSSPPVLDPDDPNEHI